MNDQEIYQEYGTEEEKRRVRLAWLMGEDGEVMSYADWVQMIQSAGIAEGSYIFYTDRMASIYTLPDDKKAAVLNAIIEEMLVRRHRPLPPDLEAILMPMALQMRKDAQKYRWRCEQRLRSTTARKR